MQLKHIAGYKFVSLKNPETWQAFFFFHARNLQLKGTLYLSSEGVNINLAGNSNKINDFVQILHNEKMFTDLSLLKSPAKTQPYKRLKIKIKKEIINFRQDEVQPLKKRTPSISPQQLCNWLDEKKSFTLIDTRNDYEVRFGTFKQAINLKLKNFCEFPQAIEKISPENPVVIFCTGGIRCEKAGLLLEKKGFSQIYQLEGGILNYFTNVGAKHYEGECFVFDERIALDANLQCTDTKQCKLCQGPITIQQIGCTHCGSLQVHCETAI